MILNHIKEVSKPKKGIYSKQKGLKSEEKKPLSSEDVSSIFADVHVGDIIRGQKCYTTGESNGASFNGKVTNKDFDGKVNWIEIGDTKLYDTDTFIRLQYHKRVGDMQESNPGHAGRPGQVGGSAPKGTGKNPPPAEQFITKEKDAGSLGDLGFNFISFSIGEHDPIKVRVGKQDSEGDYPLTINGRVKGFLQYNQDRKYYSILHPGSKRVMSSHITKNMLPSALRNELVWY